MLNLHRVFFITPYADEKIRLFALCNWWLVSFIIKCLIRSVPNPPFTAIGRLWSSFLQYSIVFLRKQVSEDCKCPKHFFEGTPVGFRYYLIETFFKKRYFPSTVMKRNIFISPRVRARDRFREMEKIQSRKIEKLDT